MKKNRLIFYSIFAGYHVIVFIFTLYLKSKQSDPLSLYPLLKYVTFFMFGSLIGILLLATDFIWTWRANRDTMEHEEALRLENNILKAKIYDLQEGTKSPSAVPPPNR